MSVNDVDRILNDWLEAMEPRNAPSKILENVFAVTRRTGQRRGFAGRVEAWLGIAQPTTRRETMNRLILAVGGVAAALVIAFVGVAYFYGPIGPAAPTGPVYTSERHGYSIILPDDSWRVLERPGRWTLGAFIDPGSPGVDALQERGVEDIHVYLSSQPIPAGMSFDAWAAIHDAANEREASCFRLQGEYETGVVGGETARIGTYRCDDFGGGDAAELVQALVAHEGRGFAIYVFADTFGSELPPRAELRATANDWLSRISFND